MPREIPQPPRKPEEPKEPELSRRDFNKGALIGLAAGTVAGALVSYEPSSDQKREREQGYAPSELFERELAGYTTLYGTLEKDEILFVDEDGAPLGKPVKLEPIDGISPGEFDEQGFIKEDISQEWLDRQRARVCAGLRVPCDIPNGLPRQMNMISQLRESVSGATGNKGRIPETYLDIVYVNGRKPVMGDPDTDRLEYIREHINKTTDLPPVIEEELRWLILGLVAQESKLNNDSESSAGARGIFQFMPKTWKDIKHRSEAAESLENALHLVGIESSVPDRIHGAHEPEDLRYLSHQVEAAGTYFTRIYRFLNKEAEFALLTAKQEYFGGSQEDFERDFLVPLMLNAYNAGEGTMAIAVKWFMDRYPTRQALEELIGAHPEGLGKDAYQALTREASREIAEGKYQIPRYGPDASQYVARLTALAELLREKD